MHRFNDIILTIDNTYLSLHYAIILCKNYFGNFIETLEKQINFFVFEIYNNININLIIKII